MGSIADMLAKVRRVLIRRGAAMEDADDIVQEAFARLGAYRLGHAVRSDEAFLMHAASNIARDVARKHKASPFAVDISDVENVGGSEPSGDEVLQARERLRRAEAGLAQLEPSVRRCLLAQRLDGMSYIEIARREGISVAAAQKRVARALLFLTKWMDGW